MRVEISDQTATAIASKPTNAQVLPATPETCFWGYLDRDQPPVMEVDSGAVIAIEAVTHHSGDAADIMMDDGVRAIWDAIDPAERAPGVHIMTGPIHVRGARPGDAILVKILDMEPRFRYGSNCAANWGLLYDVFGKERITIYELAEGEGFTATASPSYAFDFNARDLYDIPGVISNPTASERHPFTVPVNVPVRPHFGVMGVAPPSDERISSIPPGVFGGNVDNWRLGPGASMLYPVFAEGGGLYVGDPHFAQGDGEICGTAIEASINARIQVFHLTDLALTSPVLVHGSSWVTHGFGDTLDEAMRMSAKQMLWLLTDRLGLSADDAYSLSSVAVDFGVTQVVDGTVGCHGIIDTSIFG